MINQLITYILILNEKYLTFFETIPFPIGDYMNEFGNILLLNELNFDTNKMKVSYEEHIIKLNQDQKIAYDGIIFAYYLELGEFFVLSMNMKVLVKLFFF